MERKQVRIPAHLQAWIDARKRHRLTDAQVQMARELGMNPKKLGKIDNHRQEPWKLPLPQFIEESYEKRFGRPRPADASSVEKRVRRDEARKAARRAERAAKRSGSDPRPGAAETDDRPSAGASGPPSGAAEDRRTAGASCPPADADGGASRVDFQILCGKDQSIRAEVEHIVVRAQAREGRLVELGALVFLATDTGDAWLLDRQDRLATYLARDGVPLPFGLAESDERFAIEWEGTFELAGESFLFTDREGPVRTEHGYPIRALRIALDR